MSDSLVTKLGFDTSAAVKALSSLNSKLTSMSQSIEALGSKLTSFNQQGSAVASTLRSMASEANTTATAFERLAKARTSAGSSGRGGKGGGGSGGGNNSGVNAAALRDQIAELQKRYEIPKDANAVSQRRFQNSITQAAMFATQKGKTPGQVAKIGSNLSGSFTGDTNTLANKLGQVQSAFAGMQKSASQSLNKVTVDWGTFVRIISTQVIVRAMSQIQQAFNQAFQDAIKFQTAVSEIGTISDSSFGGLGTIAKQVRGISDAFNVPLNTAAEGYYETISNQIGDAAKSNQFFTEAAKFSKSAVTSLDNSVNLLSSALNSFGKDASETGDIAGKFFEVIRLGRVRADDLANTFGRVAPQARQIGVSFDELGAAIATITISGVKPAESLTQIRGVINALVKPTEQLQSAFKELGFSSAEEAIQTLGFGGTLKALAQSTDGTSAAFAKLFPNMRGINGAVITGKQQIAGYASALDDIKNAGADLNNQKFSEVFGSDAQQTEAAINRLKNALTVDLGGSLVSASAAIFRFTGGFDPLVAVVTGLTPILIAGGVALAGYIGYLASMKVGATAAQISLSTLPAGLAAITVAIGAAVAAGRTLGSAITSFANANITAALDQAAAEVYTYAAALQKANDAQKSLGQFRLQEASQLVANLNKTYMDDVENAQAANDRLLSLTRTNVESLINVRQKYVEAIRQQADKERQLAESSASKSYDIQSAIEEKLFHLRTDGLDNGRKGAAYQSRAQTLASQAQKELSSGLKSGNQDNIDHAVQKLQKARDTAEEAISVLQQGGNAAGASRAAQTFVDIGKQQLAVQKQLAQYHTNRQKALEVEEKTQNSTLDTLREQAKIVLANTGLYDANHNKFSPEEQVKRDKARTEALAKMQGLALTSTDLNKGKSLGLDKVVSQFREELTKQPYEIEVHINVAHAAMQAALQSASDKIKGGTPFFKDLQSLFPKQKFESGSDIQRGLAQANEEADKLRNSFDAAANSEKIISTNTNVIKEAVADLDGKARDMARAISINPFGQGGERQGIFGALPRLKELSNGAKVTEKDIKDVESLLKSTKGHTGVFGGSAGGGLDAGNLENILEKLRETYTEQEKLAKNPASTEQDKQINRLRQLSDFQEKSSNSGILNKWTQPAQQTASSFQSIQTSASASAATTGQIANNIERMASGAASARANMNGLGAGIGAGIGGGIGGIGGGIGEGGPMVARAAGGFIRAMHQHLQTTHLAAGGRPRGVDRIPAMLSPGEFVVNARSSRQFAPQLAAMNAGINPNYRSNGGAVTNVGDINVSVHAGQTPAHSGRVIAQSIRRELRRNTTVL